MVLAATAGACGGEEDVRDPVWGYISPAIIQPNCATANCHSNLTQRAGLRLDTKNLGYMQIRGFAASPTLSQLLRGESPVFRRMPPDVPLSDPDIALIEAWGADGAKWDGPGDPTAGTP